MKRYTHTIFALFLICMATLAQPLQAEKITIPDSNLGNFYRIDEGVYRADQPTEKDFQALEAFGIKEVLNLRRFHSNKQETKGTNLKLHRIKTYAHTIDEQEVIEALKIIKQREGPILIHCLHGSDRTGAIIAMYRIIFQGFTKEEAIEEMREGGFGHHKIFRNITRMIEDADIENIRKELGLTTDAL